MRASWLLALAFGAVAASLTPSLPAPPVTLVMIAVALVALAWPMARIAAWIALGAGWFLLNAAWQVDQQWPEQRAGELVEAVVAVAELPRWQERTLELLVRPDRSLHPDLPKRVLVRWFQPPDYVTPGQSWRMTMRLTPPRGRLNDSGFDYSRFLLTRRIGALGTVSGSPQPVDDDLGNQPIQRLRLYLAEVLDGEVGSRHAAALLRALTLADRGGIDAHLNERLRETGTAHLLAISGLHVGMVAAWSGALAGVLITPLLGWFSRLDRRRVAVLAAMAAALAYAALAGWSLPTQRALIMLLVAGGALLLRRGLAPAYALLMALAAVIVFDPLAPLATGFWLSFAAVATLIWAFAWRPAARRGLAAWFGGLLRAQLVIGIGLLPLQIGLFEQIAPVAFPANLLAIPLVGLWILPASLLAVGLILVDLPASWPLAVAAAGLDGLIEILRVLHEPGLGQRAVLGAGLWTMMAALLGSLWLLAPSAWPARWLGALLLVPLLWPRVATLQRDELLVHLFDVGNGLAVLVGTQEEWALIDSGPGDGQGRDRLGSTLNAVLARYGRDYLDRVIITQDHRGSVGGLGSVAGLSSATTTLYGPTPGAEQACTSALSWRSGAWRFRVLHPSPSLPDLGNNSACVLWIEGPGGSLLIPGRVDHLVERRLIRQANGTDPVIVLLPDGGHRRATSPELVAHFRPIVALASVARHDRFGRPHEAVKRALEQAGVELLTTGDCGALSVRLAATRPPQVTTALGRSSRFWHASGECPGDREVARMLRKPGIMPKH